MQYFDFTNFLACRDKGGQTKVREMSVNILNTFVDASSDIPRHRFNIFIHQLVKKLGSKEYLWLLTLLLISSDSRKKHGSNSTTTNSSIAGASGLKRSASVGDEKNQYLKDLYNMFDSDIDVQVQSLILMIQKTRHNDKMARNSIGIAESGHASFSALDLFDVYRVKALSFAHSLLGSEDFVRKVVQDLHLGNKVLEEKLQELLETIIESIEGFHGKMEEDEENDSAERNSIKSEKLQKLLASCLERVFEATLAIIPTRTFVKMLANLLAFEQPKNVQRKALEVLNARLSQQQQESSLEEFLINDQLPLVLEKLSLLSLNDSGDVIQQLALMCVKSLAKISTHQSTDDDNTIILQHMQKLAKSIVKKTFFNSLKQGPVIASALLCIVELFNCLGAHAVIHVKPFITWILDLVSEQKINELNPVVLNSLVVSVQRTMDNFGGFLNPFYPRLVIATCEMTAWHQNQEVENLVENKNEFRQTAQRIKQLQMALSKGIPTHSLIQISKQCFDDVKEKPYAIIALSNIIKENVGELEKTEILASSTPLLDFFMHAFKYREEYDGHDENHEVVVDLVEKSVGEAFMTFALKLALDDFKPLYYRLFNLALDSHNLDGITTLFHITEQIANKLKSLFSFVCEMLVQKATTVLQDLSKKAEEVSMNDYKDSRRRIIATSYVLDALASMYKYNR